MHSPLSDSGHLTEDALHAARASVPIVCADLVPTRWVDGTVEVGLIQREMPERASLVWCHLGGRGRRGETIRAALVRHLDSTIGGVRVDLPTDPQPARVVQYFPPDVPVDAGLRHGMDPRQHAVALVFAVELSGEPVVVPGGEALAFRWWTREEVAASDELWPGVQPTVDGALSRWTSGRPGAR